MKKMGRLGESTLLDLENQTQREVQQRSVVDSPMLPRVTAQRLAAAGAPRDDRVLEPPAAGFAMLPATISVSRLMAQTEQQASPSALGGVGFSLFDEQHPAWRAYASRTARASAFAFVDLYSEEEASEPLSPTERGRVGSGSSNGGSGSGGTGKRMNPFFQESGPPPPPLPSGSRSPRADGPKSPRYERSGSVWEEEVQGEAKRLVVTSVMPRAVERVFLGQPRVLPHSCLLAVEIQLQQLAHEGKCFHVLLLMEDVKQLDSLFAQSADQWSHAMEGVTSRVWVAQSGGAALQRMVNGSKHAGVGELRLWRSAWRKRPHSCGCVLIEYLVAAHPELHRSRNKAAALSSASTADESSVAVVRDCDVFREGPEAVLNVLGVRDVLVTHEISAVRLVSVASRQTLRSVAVSARRVRVAGFQLFCVCSDDPPRVEVYDLVNENMPVIVLACPEVVPTDIVVRPLGQLRQVSVLACGPDRLVHVWHVPKAGSEVRPSFSLALHRDYVTCMEASPHYIFSGSCDCTIGVWDHSGALVQHLTGHTDWIFSLVLVPPVNSSSHAALLSCSRDATLRLWQLGPDGFGSCLRVISTSGSRALSCAIQPGSGLAAVALGNNRIALLDLLDGSGARPRVLTGHAGRVTALVFWRQFVISASLDNSLRVWDAAGQCLLALKAHQDSINGVHVANDVLYSGSDDGTVRMWRLADLGLEAAAALNPETPRNKSGVFKAISLSGKFKSPKTSAPGTTGGAGGAGGGGGGGEGSK